MGSRLSGARRRGPCVADPARGRHGPATNWSPRLQVWTWSHTSANRSATPRASQITTISGTSGRSPATSRSFAGAGRYLFAVNTESTTISSYRILSNGSLRLIGSTPSAAASGSGLSTLAWTPAATTCTWRMLRSPRSAALVSGGSLTEFASSPTAAAVGRDALRDSHRVVLNQEHRHMQTERPRAPAGGLSVDRMPTARGFIRPRTQPPCSWIRRPSSDRIRPQG